MTADPPTGASTVTAVLRRVVARRPAAVTGARCEMCAEQVPDLHQHVVDLQQRGLLCTCRACYLLFTAERAELRYRAVPDRYLSFPSFALGPAQWDVLDIPVGMAFFFFNSALGRTVCFYPGPAGAAETELPLDAWDAVVAANPELSALRPDVEALLIRMPDLHAGPGDVARNGPGPDAGPDADAECYLVPIDCCYELVGRLRRTWRGFDGGQEARAAVADFFATVAARSRTAPAHGDNGVVPDGPGR